MAASPPRARGSTAARPVACCPGAPPRRHAEATPARAEAARRARRRAAGKPGSAAASGPAVPSSRHITLDTGTDMADRGVSGVWWLHRSWLFHVASRLITMPVMDAESGGGATVDRELVVGLLGPVELVSPGGGLTGLAQPMLRILVAMLGVMAGRAVPDEALVDALWGEEWSRERGQNLHTHVSALRRRMAAALPSGGSRVVRSGGGYRLALAEDEVDAGLFRSLAARGRQAARAADIPSAADLFTQALRLWRGPALADVLGLCPRLAGDAAGLEELRAGVLEERVECDLMLGRHGDVVAEGPALVAEFPLSERLAGQLMGGAVAVRAARRGTGDVRHHPARAGHGTGH